MKILFFREIIEVLNAKELKRLESFLNSPYHNRSNEIIELFNFIKKKDSDLSAFVFTEETMKDLFKKPGINKYRFNRIVSEFTELLYDFLLNENFKFNRTEKVLNLVRVLRERNAVVNAERTNNELGSILKQSRFIDNNFYYRNIKKEKFRNTVNFTELVYSDKKEFQEISDQTDHFFIIEKLQSFIMMTYHKAETSYSIDYDPAFKKEIIEFIEKNESTIKKKHNLMYLYYLVLRMLEEGTGDTYFNIFRKYLFANIDNISEGHFKELIMDYKNNCDNRIYTDQKKYGNETLKVYMLMDEKGIFIIDNRISHVDFLNAVITALAFKKRAWAGYFFEKYKGLLDVNFKEDVLHLANSNIYFYDRNLADALLELNKINSKQFYYYLRIRLLRIKIYYDLDETESVNYILDSVKHYIKRNKELIGINYHIVENFLKTMRILLRLKNKFSEKEYLSLLKYLQNEESIYSRDWINQESKELRLSPKK
jgi:hypothetical protein